MSQEYLKGLNVEQQDAVLWSGQGLMVLAGAGSGKTKLLISRIAYLLDEKQVPPQKIMAVTFTNKAANEMKLRLREFYDNPQSLWLGTFHSICYRLLNLHSKDLGFPKGAFSVMDTQDQVSVLRRVLKRMNLSTEIYVPSELIKLIARAKQQLMRANTLESYSNEDYDPRFIDIYKEYESLCQQEGLIDFPEIILKAYELLKDNPLIRESYISNFDHILIDEFQDTNILQYEWLKLLVDRSEKVSSAEVVAVGDDDQSIYSFRGATVENMHRFQEDFFVNKVIRLEQNYRSHQNILNAANHLISYNQDRMGKNLWSSLTSTSPVFLTLVSDDTAEAKNIIKKIKSLHQEGHSYSSMVILYRANSQSRVFEHCLFQHTIPYIVYGATRFYDRAEIKSLVAYLRLLINTDDNHSFMRIINFPTRGIGARTIEAIEEIAVQKNISLYAAANDKSLHKNKKLFIFCEMMEGCHKLMAELSFIQFIEKIIHVTGLFDHYNNQPNSEGRVDNLLSFSGMAQSYMDQQKNKLGDNWNHLQTKQILSGFVNEMIIDTLNSADLDEEGHNCVSLMTVHSVKGLEFDTVFLTGLEQGVFPVLRSMSRPQGLEEERRLMYVAMTRARKNLYMSSSDMRYLYNQAHHYKKSCFLNEILENKTLNINIQDLREESNYRNFTPQSMVKKQAPSNKLSLLNKVLTHPKFGRGVVLLQQGYDSDALVQVQFEHLGVKWLSLGFIQNKCNVITEIHG